MEQTVINVAAPYLPEEIMTNILKRLPVKSLLRFRCVCKHWKNLFKTPSFIQEHLSHSTNQDPSLLMVPDWSNFGFFLFLFNCKMQFGEFDNAPLIGSLRGFELVGSSNGLLCFVDMNKYPPAPLVWNPATREVKQVPSDEFSGLYLVDDFDVYFGWSFGFGFNPIINDYKIVRLSGSSVTEAKVYSLSKGSWRNIQFDEMNVSVISDGVTVNGVTFWYGSNDNYIMGGRRHVIVSFDLATEVFTVIPWPRLASYSGPDFLSYSTELAVYDDKLAVISHHETKYSQYSSIYLEVMEEGAIASFEQRWSSSKKFINDSNLKLCFGTIWRNQIVCMGKPTYSERGIKNTEHLYLIDVIANGCKRFDIPKPTSGLHVKVFSYVESLVSVSGNIQIEET